MLMLIAYSIGYSIITVAARKVNTGGENDIITERDMVIFGIIGVPLLICATLYYLILGDQ